MVKGIPVIDEDDEEDVPERPVMWNGKLYWKMSVLDTLVMVRP